jgi:uncharacterized protein
MSNSDHPTPRDIAVGFFDDINSGRFEEALARLAPDIAYDVVSPAPYRGVMNRDELGQFIARYVAPKLTGPIVTQILGVTAEGERVATEAKVNAPGREGRDYENRLHFLFVVRNGKIVEAREYLDSAVFVTFVSRGD